MSWRRGWIGPVGLAMTLAGLCPGIPPERAEATHMTFAPGDIFVSLRTGEVEWRHPDGSLNRLLVNVVPGKAEGMGFDAAGNLYVAHYCADLSVCRIGNAVEKFAPTGVSTGSFGSGYDCNPYAIVFDAAGRAYVGQGDCTGDLLQFDAFGALLQAFPVAWDNRGSARIDLAADGCTMFYTSQGPNVKRYDVCAGQQLPDFNTTPSPSGETYGLRVLPDGDVLVAMNTLIGRLDASGNLVQTYNVPGEPELWQGLDLVGDGAFWASNYGSSNVYRFDIATGAVLGAFNAGTPTTTVKDVLVGRAPTQNPGAIPGTFAPGDLFVALRTGEVQWWRPDGTLNSVLVNVIPGKAEGMRLDADGNLYVTHYCADLSVCRTGNAVEKFAPTGVSTGSFGSGYDCNPESIVFDAVGRAYVGQSDCTGDLLQFDAFGTLLQASPVAPDNRGSARIDLAADGCTMFYTSQGPNVKRYDVCAGRQLPDFNTAPSPSGETYGLRALPDGGVLVAMATLIGRLDASGSLVQTYTVPGEPGVWWLGVDLAGDGTFWASNYASSNVYRFDIATGAVLGGFNTGTPTTTIKDVVVKR